MQKKQQLQAVTALRMRLDCTICTVTSGNGVTTSGTAATTAHPLMAVLGLTTIAMGENLGFDGEVLG
ncbi:hypothetical protein AY599_21700 [Leptolyngbya valderiana BDU 20041]|nr:hypothetical protein AY599_21700 [Leptolyngbya valderiana BDU 20041]